MRPFHYGDSSKDYNYNLNYNQKRGISFQCHISDLHFGKISPKVEFDILKEQFIDKIKLLPLDCISVDGDLFDRLFMSNTDAILYANLFFSELFNICKNNKRRGIDTVLIIILGTKTHDSDQLRLFYPYLDDPEVDFRIIEKIQFEWVHGCRVLCIPELYGVPEEEYQKILFQSGTYDMVFMHGTIEGAVYDDKTTIGKSRIFTPYDFSCCKGPVIAGHVHTGPFLHGFCYYNGSPIRWTFGEEEPKGFQLVLYDMDSRYYYVHKEIITSFRYDTISIDDIIMTDPKEVIKYINNLREKEGIDYIRLKCSTTPYNQDNLNILKEYYRNDNTVKFKLEKERIGKEGKSEETSKLYDQYEYFFNRSMSPYQVLAKFINDSQSDIIVTADQIINILKEE